MGETEFLYFYMALRRNEQRRRRAIYDYVKCNAFRYIVHTTLRSFSCVSSNYHKMHVRRNGMRAALRNAKVAHISVHPSPVKLHES